MTTPQASSPSGVSHDAAVDATRQLALVLGRIGDALAAVDASALLALDGELNGALAALCATKIGDREAARAAAKQGLAALQRCQRLGASLTGVSRALRQAGPRTDGYDRAGSFTERTVRASVLVRA
ncbi:MAG: hypothetical protein ABJA98_08965 [Acidobacteriota bacterium]